MRAPLVVRWPGAIRPGTVKNDIFASLDWLPTLVNIAGGAKGDALNRRIEAGSYPGIVKTTLDGVDQPEYLDGTFGEVGARHLLLLFGQATRRRCATRTGRCTSRWCPTHRLASFRACSRSTWPRWSTSSVIPSRPAIGFEYKTAHGLRRRTRRPPTAYIYDWNMLPIGQALWLKELESYKEFPPMQDPASYNLDQVMQQIKKATKGPAD